MGPLRVTLAGPLKGHTDVSASSYVNNLHCYYNMDGLVLLIQIYLFVLLQYTRSILGAQRETTDANCDNVLGY